jgi:hypothetical protein
MGLFNLISSPGVNAWATKSLKLWHAPAFTALTSLQPVPKIQLNAGRPSQIKNSRPTVFSQA